MEFLFTDLRFSYNRSMERLHAAFAICAAAWAHSEYFNESGAEKYKYIPCLNDNKEHLNFISHLIYKNIQGWNIE